MLRGMMPGQVVGEGLRGLGGREEMGWVDGWFEAWFLGGAAVTATGIWVGRRLGGGGWEDEEWEVEGGGSGGGSGGGGGGGGGKML